MKTKTVHVDTEKYEARHGHAPRGAGLWCFEIADDGLAIVGMYNRAKAQAIRHAQRLGVDKITLLP